MGEELERSEEELERSWKHPGLRADVKAVLGILSPERAEVVVEWLDSWHVRDEERGRAAFEAATDAAGTSADELLDRIMADERLTDLFRMTMELAARSGSERKLRGLGRALARGALARDDATFDEAQLALRTIGQLEPMDVRGLAALNGPRWPLVELPLGIKAHLEQLGLAREEPEVSSTSVSKSAIEGGEDEVEVELSSTFEVTSYGRKILELLLEEGGTKS